MIAKTKEKTKAIELRKQGFSYGEIQKIVPVSKASLSLWLQDVELTVKQKKRLTDKWIMARQKGWEARRRQRVDITEKIKKQARNEIKNVTKRDLWMIGIALYWAEGSKEKEENGVVRSSPVALGNSDPYLIKVFLKWLFVVCNVPRSDIVFRILLHKNSRHRLFKVKKYWSDVTGFHEKDFQRVTWKKHSPKTNRKNIGNNYFGLLEVRVRRSTNFNRKIAGWVDSIHNRI